MALIVRKYGGMTLSTPENIRNVAESVAELHRRGDQVIVVVSAMGKTTDSLQSLAYQLSDKPNRREFDMLLSTGERVSAALLSIALNELGCPSISFTGSQAGILTNRSHTDAKIIAVRPIRLEEELKKNKVIVLAGFQGVCPETKEITTLGRGGSDTTAVAMAGHFQASRCEILKDVDGIYSGDPKTVENPVHLPRINHQQLYEMSFWGGKFLHHRSSELARDLSIPLLIDSAHGPRRGTFIDAIEESETAASDCRFLSVNRLANVIELKNSSPDLVDRLNERLQENEWPPLRPLPSLTTKDSLYACHDFSRFPEALIGAETHRKDLATLAMTYSSAPNPQAKEKIRDSLKAINVFPAAMTVNGYSVIAVLDQTNVGQAMAHLHGDLIAPAFAL